LVHLGSDQAAISVALVETSGIGGMAQHGLRIDYGLSHLKPSFIEVEAITQASCLDGFVGFPSSSLSSLLGICGAATFLATGHRILPSDSWDVLFRNP
jgi:hypothetical protein